MDESDQRPKKSGEMPCSSIRSLTRVKMLVFPKNNLYIYYNHNYINYINPAGVL